MLLCYSKASKPSALAIAAASEGEIQAFRWREGGVYDINWGVRRANATLNPNIYNVVDKYRMRKRFEAASVPMPGLVDPFIDWDFSYPLVGRPDVHTRGKGFWLCHNAHDLHRAYNGTKKKQPATHFMEYIDATNELRVHIVAGKSIRISEKHFWATEGGHKLYTTIKPTVDRNTLKKARRAAKQAVAAVGLDFGCVDILVDHNNQVYVLEVNSSPGLGGSLPKLYAEKLVEAINEVLAKLRREG